MRIALNTRLRLTLRFRCKPRIGKRLRKLAKNLPKRGKSARHGNRPSPYTKYNKTPYHYNLDRRKGPSPMLVIDNSSSEYMKPSRELRTKKTAGAR